MAKKVEKDEVKARPIWSKGVTEEVVTFGEGEYKTEFKLRTLNYDVFTHCNMQKLPDVLFFRLGVVSVTNLRYEEDGVEKVFEISFEDYDINGVTYKKLDDKSWDFFKENTMATIMVTNAIKKLSGLTVDDILALKFFRPTK